MDKTFSITVAPAAIERMGHYLDAAFQGEERQTAGILVSAVPGGCSGFQYELKAVATAETDWHVEELEGARVFVNKFSQLYLNGVTIDYVNGILGSGFTFKNPNSSNTCGCGSSFSA